MTLEAPMCGKRRGFRRRLWIAAIALPVSAFVVGNAWLASPPGRSWVGGKIQNRCGLEARLGGVSVTPWSGIVLRKLELLQPEALRVNCPEPLARIESIRLSPVWRAWFQGKRELQSVELDSPRLMIPIELMASLAHTQSPPQPQGTAPAVAAPPTPSPPAAVPPNPGLPLAPAVPAAPEQTTAPAPILSPTSWLHLKNASFTLFSAKSGQKALQISGIDGSIPVSGATADSSLQIHSVATFAQPILTKVETELNWKAPLLSLKPIDLQIHGFKTKLAAKLAMLSGLPLQIDAHLPPQPLPSIPLPSGASAGAEAITANSRFRGLLLAPSTWQGDLVAQANSPSGSVAGKDASFDKGSAVIVLRGSILSCTDARLIGDELSFLGNATLLADGRAAAVLRMVAPPETITAVATHLFPDIPQPPSLTPLSSPQRAAFDLEAFGNIGDISLRIGKNGPIIHPNR